MSEMISIGDKVKVEFGGGFTYEGTVSRVCPDGTEIGNGEINSSGKTIYVVKVTDKISFDCFDDNIRIII